VRPEALFFGGCTTPVKRREIQVQIPPCQRFAGLAKRVHPGTAGDRIAWHREHVGVSDQDLCTFLLGSAVGALLIQRGLLVLHDNALEKEGQAAAGRRPGGHQPRGAGAAGHPAHQALARRRQGIEKYVLMGDAIQRVERAVPLRALDLLRQQRHPREDGEACRITRITSQKAAALRLRNQAFRPRFVRGLGQEGPNFMALARLQNAVPSAILHVPAGIAAMQHWLEQQDLLQAAEAQGPEPAEQKELVSA
jgi:hypothetical protein